MEDQQSPLETEEILIVAEGAECIPAAQERMTRRIRQLEEEKIVAEM